MTQTNLSFGEKLRWGKSNFVKQDQVNKYIIQFYVILWFYLIGRVMRGLFTNPLILVDIHGDVCFIIFA